MEVKYPSGAINYNKEYGQVWTEASTAEYLLKRMNEISRIRGKILEPCVGDRVFINEVSKYPYDQLDGFEADPVVYNQFRSLGNILNRDFLLDDILMEYDFIIGGFPFLYLHDSFYNSEQRNFLRSKYHPIFGEELRLMNMFIHKSYSILKTGGFMPIIIHKYSLLSDKLKKFLDDFFEIKLLEDVKNRPFMKMVILEKLSKPLDV